MEKITALLQAVGDLTNRDVVDKIRENLNKTKSLKCVDDGTQIGRDQYDSFGTEDHSKPKVECGAYYIPADLPIKN